MATYKTNAIVLKKTKLKEADLILTLLAEDGSQKRCVAKGARKPGGRFTARLEQLSEVSLMVYEGKNLDTITEVSTIESNEACRADLEHLSYAAVVAQFVEKTTFEGQESPVLYPLTKAALASLGRAPLTHAPYLVAAFLLKAAAYMGLRPSLDACVSCGTPLPGPVAATFSIPLGGWVCDTCAEGEAPVSPYDAADPQVVEWVRSLLGMRFAEVEALQLGDGSSFLAGELLDFCGKWVRAHMGFRLKALDYLSALGV